MKKKYFKLVNFIFITFLFLWGTAKGDSKTMTGKKNNSNSNQSILNFFILSGTTAKTKISNHINESELEIKSIMGTFNKENIINQLKKFFDHKIDNIKIESSIQTILPVMPENLDKINLVKDEFLIKFSIVDKPIVESPIKGKITFFNRKKNTKHHEDFSIEKGNSLIGVLKSNSKILLAVVVHMEKTIMDSNKIYKGKNFTIYTNKNFECIDEVHGDEIIFKNARAVIHSEEGDMELTAENIIYQPKMKRLIAENATVKFPDNNIRAGGKRIEIYVEKK